MPEPAFEVATVGDNCIDRYLPPVGLSTVGGNAVNVAVQLRRLGRPAAYFGAVGLDAAGMRTLAALRHAGVPVDRVERRAGRTAFTEIGVDAAGERTIGAEDFGVCAGYRPSAETVATLASMRHVHVGWLDDGGATKRTLLERGVALSQDLTVNAEAGNLAAAGLAIAFASAGPSRERATALAQTLLAQGARLAVVTMGALGSIASEGSETAQTGIRPADVVDTTGAGDTFIAGFIDARLKGLPLRACLEAGRDAAAVTCTHLGGFPQEPQPLD